MVNDASDKTTESDMNKDTREEDGERKIVLKLYPNEENLDKIEVNLFVKADRYIVMDFEELLMDTFSVHFAVSDNRIEMKWKPYEHPVNVNSMVGESLKDYNFPENWHRAEEGPTEEHDTPEYGNGTEEGPATETEINRRDESDDPKPPSDSGDYLLVYVDAGDEKFMILSPNFPKPDGEFTVFGKVTKGQGTIDHIIKKYGPDSGDGIFLFHSFGLSGPT